MCIMLHYFLWTIIFHSIKLICDFMICYTCCISDNVTWGIVRLTYINLKKIINWTKMLKLIVRVRIYTYLKKKNRKYLHIILLSLALYSSQENSFCQLSCNFLLVLPVKVVLCLLVGSLSDASVVKGISRMREELKVNIISVCPAFSLEKCHLIYHFCGKIQAKTFAWPCWVQFDQTFEF